MSVRAAAALPVEAGPPGLGFMAVVIDYYLILSPVQTSKIGLILLTNLQQNRGIYDRKCNYDSHEYRSCSRGRTYVPEVAEVVEDEAPRHRLDDHLGRVDHQKDVPVQRKKEGRNIRSGGGNDE